MTKRKKPGIEQVFDAFQEYMREQSANISNVREPKKWSRNLKAAQKRLREKLEALGLAEHIDWTKTDDGLGG